MPQFASFTLQLVAFKREALFTSLWPVYFFSMALVPARRY